MNDLEHRISQYLDGELSPSELAEFRELLDSSEEARRMLGSMELIRSAARSFPILSAPDPALESALFQELFAEGDWTPRQVEEEDRRRGGLIPLLRSGIGGISAIGIGRTALALPVLLLLILVGERFVNGSNVVPTERTETVAAVTPQKDRAIAGQKSRIIRGIENGATPVEAADIRRTGTGAERSNAGTAAKQTVQPQFITTPENRPGPVERKDDVQGTPERMPENLPDDRPSENAFAQDDDRSPQDPRDIPPSLFDGNDFDRPDSDDPASSSFLSASYRHGVATFFGERESVLASGQDMNLRIDGQLAERHRVSVVVGSSPVLVAERTYTLLSSTGPGDPKGPGTPTTASIRTEESNRVDDEVWAGVGYGYTIFEGNGFRVEAGVNAGLGEQSTRYGLELPARISVTDRIGVEVVPYITRIVPRDQEIRDSEISGENFEQFGEEWTPNSTSVGAQIGLSFSFGG